MDVTLGKNEYVTAFLDPLGDQDEKEAVENLALVSSDESIVKVVHPSIDSPLDDTSYDIMYAGPGNATCDPKADALVGEGEQIIVGPSINVTCLKTLATHIGVRLSEVKTVKPVTP